MLKVVVLFLLYLSSYFGLICCSERVPNIDLRIADGSPADIKDFPYMVSLHRLKTGNNKYWCGAAILSTSWAVTAAHCVYGRAIQKVRLHSGSSYKNTGGHMHGVQEIKVHPKFNITGDYDVAVIKVSNPFTFSAEVKSIDMASQEPSVGTNAVIAGWGKLDKMGAVPDQLQKLGVFIISNQECSRLFRPQLTERMLCASSSNNGTAVCKGDSGSPLVANGELIGINSWGKKTCGFNTAVYANIFLLRPWITSITGVN